MKKSDLIRATDCFKAFDSFNNLFCNSWLEAFLQPQKPYITVSQSAMLLSCSVKMQELPLICLQHSAAWLKRTASKI